jgi:CRP-like cAMP-binding protein
MVTPPNPELTLVREILRGVPVFTDLTTPELELFVALGRVVSYPKGTTFFAEGDKGGSLYVIISGSVRIAKGAPGERADTIGFIGKGACFGEMALIDDLPRSASAVAEDDCLVLELDRNDALDLFHENPYIARKVLWAFCRSLSLRLREAGDRIVFLSSPRGS